MPDAERFFVMLTHPTHGHPVPVTDDGTTVALFESEQHADRAMARHSAAQAWGYEVYAWPRVLCKQRRTVMPNAPAVNAMHDVHMVCENEECPVQTFDAQIEVTGAGTFYVDGTDQCPICGQGGERSDG